MTNPGWTHERVERLKELWLGGKSFSEIAADLKGGVTRNAVVGKVHRLGLSGRDTPSDLQTKVSRGVRAAVARQAPKIKAEPKPKAPKPIKPPVVVGVDFVASRDADRKRAEFAAKGQASIKAATDPVNDNAIPLLERRIGQCAWPVGTPERASDQMVCGGRVYQGVEACPYCLTHARRAYVRDITQPNPAENLARSLRRWAA